MCMVIHMNTHTQTGSHIYLSNSVRPLKHLPYSEHTVLIFKGIYTRIHTHNQAVNIIMKVRPGSGKGGCIQHLHI